MPQPTVEDDDHERRLNSRDRLSLHFRACEDVYVQIARSAGFRDGWTVLDVGTGTGHFIPTLLDLVGPKGSLITSDFEDDVVQQLRREFGGLSGLEIRQLDVTDLEIPDSSVDAVWMSNVTSGMFADDTERVLEAISECRRVLKPGGILALKEIEGRLFRLHPSPPGALRRYFERCYHSNHPHRPLNHAILGASRLKRTFEKLGFTDVRQRSFMLDHWKPFTPLQRTWVIEFLTGIGRVATGIEMPEHAQFWEALMDPAHPDNPLHDDEFYIAEANTLIVGTKPS